MLVVMTDKQFARLAAFMFSERALLHSDDIVDVCLLRHVVTFDAFGSVCSFTGTPVAGKVRVEINGDTHWVLANKENPEDTVSMAICEVYEHA